MCLHYKVVLARLQGSRQMLKLKLIIERRDFCGSQMTEESLCLLGQYWLLLRQFCYLLSGIHLTDSSVTCQWVSHLLVSCDDNCLWLNFETGCIHSGFEHNTLYLYSWFWQVGSDGQRKSLRSFTASIWQSIPKPRSRYGSRRFHRIFYETSTSETRCTGNSKACIPRWRTCTALRNSRRHAQPVWNGW